MLCKRLWALLLAVMTLVPAAVAAAETATITAEGVNLRQQADTESNALRTLALGSQVQVLAQEGGWYRVLLPDETVGYIRQDYIFVQDGGSRGAYVLDDDTALRGGPDEHTYAVERLAAGQGGAGKTGGRRMVFCQRQRKSRLCPSPAPYHDHCLYGFCQHA